MEQRIMQQLQHARSDSNTSCSCCRTVRDEGAYEKPSACCYTRCGRCYGQPLALVLLKVLIQGGALSADLPFDAAAVGRIWWEECRGEGFGLVPLKELLPSTLEVGGGIEGMRLRREAVELLVVSGHNP
ncbi:hypothetical protein ACSSS7_001118 [Eimeria intestinalis]